MKKSGFARAERGITLIELMIALAIAGILASIAVPAYTEHLARGRIAQGLEALSEAKLRMEQVYNSNRTYATSTDPDASCPDLSALFSDTPFTVAVSNCPTTSGSPSFTLTATGRADKNMSGYSYTIDQGGTKTSRTPAVGASVNCWLMNARQTSC